ncbi:hypothetical protein [Streptomyces virginiae]|uniref:hypothetical protein n=1 Tax=Streptomyces virginiae TaxID=1961 RepID=UPI0036639CE0
MELDVLRHVSSVKTSCSQPGGVPTHFRYGAHRLSVPRRDEADRQPDIGRNMLVPAEPAGLVLCGVIAATGRLQLSPTSVTGRVTTSVSSRAPS